MNFEKLISLRLTKRILASILLGVIATSAICSYSKKAFAHISESVVRLHILANSDNSEDQQLKLTVRDGIASYMQLLLGNSKSAEESKLIIGENLENIKNEAEKIIKKQGYTYSITTDLDESLFPRKSYSDVTLPKGKYCALKITIGEGDGKNWWCVLFPQLCFSSSDKGFFEDGEKDRLKTLLTEDEYEIINSKEKINFKLKVLEYFAD